MSFLLHAVATINLRADHISGTVINLMAPALGVFLVKVIYQKRYDYTIIWLFSFPGLSKIPVIGELFFKTSLPAFVAILIAILTSLPAFVAILIAILAFCHL